MELFPKFPATFVETEGGGYYNWAVADSPVLGESKVAAGKLILKPRGFCLPHYADCPKVGYVLEGKCGVGLTIPGNTNTKVEMPFICLKKGDIIPILSTSVSWWYNHGDSDVVIVFFADATEAYVAGEVNYFFLTGPLGHLPAFSPEFVAKTYRIKVEEAKTLAGSQENDLFIKLSEEEAETIPEPNEEMPNVWTRNINASSPDVEVVDGGKSTTLDGTKFPSLEQVGLSFGRLVLETNATRTPSYASRPRLFYVAKGSGEVQIAGLLGKLVMNTKVETGQLFVVPRFFVVTMSADEEGMELVSIITSSRAIIGELGSVNSVMNTIPSIMKVNLNVTPELTQHFKRMMEIGTVIVPPILKADDDGL